MFVTESIFYDVWFHIFNYSKAEDKCSLAITCKFLYDVYLSLPRYNLFPNQYPHYNKILDALCDKKAVIDSTLMGYGKTYTTCAICAKLNLTLTVICPKSVIPIWKTVSNIYKIKDIMLITYSGLSSKKSPFIHKTWYVTAEGKRKAELHIKSGWVNRAFNTLLVFDEAHYLKNDSIQSKAAEHLTTFLYSETVNSRVMFLSATLMDKEKHINRFLKLLNIMEDDKLRTWDLVNQMYNYTGWNQVLKKCKSINPIITDEFVGRGGSDKDGVDIFEKIIKPSIIFAMNPIKYPFDLDAKNGYYQLSQNNHVRLLEALKELARIAREDDNRDFLGIGKFLREIELCKIDTICNAAIKVLAKNNYKVVIMLSYLDPIYELVNKLKDYGSISITGSDSIIKREHKVNAFNNSEKVRVIICNINVASLGISLHDTIGDSPRFMFISPTYHLINMHQATRRIYRNNIKSNATVRFVYCNPKDVEARILNSLARKTNVLRKVTSNVLKDIKYPTEYENIDE